MGALLPWASADGSPVRFHLHHATSARPPAATLPSKLELLAADYGLKARSASGRRGEDVDDLALLQTHIARLGALPQLGTDAQALIRRGLSRADPRTTPPFQARAALLDLGDPQLPYSIFEPHSPQQDGLAGMLPLRFTGAPVSHGHETNPGPISICSARKPTLPSSIRLGASPHSRFSTHRVCVRGSAGLFTRFVRRLSRQGRPPYLVSAGYPPLLLSFRPLLPLTPPPRPVIGTNRFTTGDQRFAPSSPLPAPLWYATRLPLVTSDSVAHLRHPLELPPLWAQPCGSSGGWNSWTSSSSSTPGPPSGPGNSSVDRHAPSSATVVSHWSARPGRHRAAGPRPVKPWSGGSYGSSAPVGGCTQVLSQGPHRPRTGMRWERYPSARNLLPLPFPCWSARTRLQ